MSYRPLGVSIVLGARTVAALWTPEAAELDSKMAAALDYQ
jgi:hypothetical protein